MMTNEQAPIKEEAIYRVQSGCSRRYGGGCSSEQGGCGARGGGDGAGGGGGSRARGAVAAGRGRATPVRPQTTTTAPAWRDQRANDEGSRCTVCGLFNHNKNKCRFRNYRCQKCGEKGHLKKVCDGSNKCSRNYKIDETGSDADTDEASCKECNNFNISVSVEVSWCLEDQIFPPTFKFGAASSSYQVEGAWNVSDKSESIWDRFTHSRPDAISDGSDGDVACDSYHLWRRDIEMAVELGLDFYRFSISWPRLLPTGFSNYISEDGKNYYSNLIDGLLEKGIEPVVTIFHWDLPQRFQDLGGWTNPLISDWFADYARVVYSLYGDRVKTWITINEPFVICDVIYNTGIVDPDRASYLCNKYLLIAHAKAWRLYDEQYRHLYHGEVSISNNLLWFEPHSDEDIELTELTKEYMARFCHPIYSKEGGWPQKIETLIAEKSVREGYTSSRLPAFTQEEIQLIKGTFDFYALNHYSTRLIRKALPGEQIGAWPLNGIPELGVILQNDPNWELSGLNSEYLQINPVSLRRMLVFLKQRYGDIKILITENGYADAQSGLEDDRRVNYFKGYLQQVLLAIKEDNVNVMGYTAWTLMDNFEWWDGYVIKFGLYEVDFTDPARTRTPRKSMHYYANVIKTHSLEPTK